MLKMKFKEKEVKIKYSITPQNLDHQQQKENDDLFKMRQRI